MQMRVTRQQVERMIRYEDAEVIVVHKPPFLAVETRDPRQQDLLRLLINRRIEMGEAAFIGIISRLDQPVEGLLLFAKTKESTAAVSTGLRAGDLTKEYLAVVTGVTEESGTLIHTLKKDGRTNTSVAVPAGTAGGKEARLSYERLAVADEKSLLRIHLDTGRHHQIRVQFATIGHPLLGDTKYGGTAVGGCAGQPLALCSSRLVFAHPRTKEMMEFHTMPTGAGFELFKGALG